MKRICLLAVLLISFAVVSAQCDKKYKFKTERVVKINADGSEGEEEPISAEITIGKDSVILMITVPDGNQIEMSGKVKETVCKINADYTEGTVDFNGDMEASVNGETRNMKIIFKLEAKAGKIKIFGTPEERPEEKICFVIKEKEAK